MCGIDCFTTKTRFRRFPPNKKHAFSYFSCTSEAKLLSCLGFGQLTSSAAMRRAAYLASSSSPSTPPPPAATACPAKARCCPLRSLVAACRGSSRTPLPGTSHFHATDLCPVVTYYCAANETNVRAAILFETIC